MDGYALRRAKALLNKLADEKIKLNEKGELAGERVGSFPPAADSSKTKRAAELPK